MIDQHAGAPSREIAPCESTVFFTSLHATAGGSDRALETLLMHLDNVHRIIATPNRDLASRLLEGGVAQDVMPLPRGGSSPFARARLVASVFVAVWKCRKQLTAIHANGVFDLAIAWSAALISNRPVVVWSHKSGRVPAMTRLGAKVATRVLRNVRWVACSDVAREELVRARLAPSEVIEVIPNPIDPALVTVGCDGHDGVNVGFLGNASFGKGFDVLPAVMSHLDDVDVRWVVYSNRRPDGRMEDVWRRVAGRSNVEVVGKVADVRDAYAHCDIVFCPSRSESFGRVAAEAMMNGIPVVASRIPAFQSTVGHDNGGLLFPEGDADAAAAALRVLITDRSLRERLASNARRRAHSYDPETIASRFREVYASTAAARA